MRGAYVSIAEGAPRTFVRVHEDETSLGDVLVMVVQLVGQAVDKGASINDNSFSGVIISRETGTYSILVVNRLLEEDETVLEVWLEFDATEMGARAKHLALVQRLVDEGELHPPKGVLFDKRQNTKGVS